jgi:hypothetical protein
MSLRISLGIAAVVFTALTAVSCSPPLIRCETDNHCTEDMKCDVRQGLCVDKGEHIEPDGGTVTGGSTDCHTASGCPSDSSCITAYGQPVCLAGHQPPEDHR